jgi:hypothetical protein
VLQPQESQLDVPQDTSQEEEPFEIELVVPESPIAQGSPTEEQQHSRSRDTKDKTDEEHPPPSDTEAEKTYRDADEVESLGAEASVLAGKLRALLEHLGITTAPRYRIKEVPHLGQVEFKATCSRRLALLIREEQLGLLEGLVLNILEQRFRHNVSYCEVNTYNQSIKCNKHVLYECIEIKRN